MPYPRPVSPISLESCEISPFETDPDDLLASDEEIDGAARAAKRQRVEKLAQSYLQGKPLSILSASLRGPFDDGWVNPWKKNRSRGASASSARVLSNRHTNVPERVVQETDLRVSKHRQGLSVSSRRAEIPPSSFDSPGASVHTADRSSPSKPSRGNSRKSTPRPARSVQPGSSRRSPAKSTEQQSLAVEDRSINHPRTADWLRKDRTLMNFTKFEPPSSPTTSVASRHSDKARRPAPRVVHVQVPQTPGSPMKSHPAKPVMAKTTLTAPINTNAHPFPQNIQTATTASPKAPTIPKLSPLQKFQQTHMSEEASLRVVDSSSQLPRFEYRRWPRDHSSQQERTSPMQDESILQEETFLEADSPLKDKTTAEPAPAGPVRNIPLDPVAPEPSVHREIVICNESSEKEIISHKTMSKETRFADEHDVAEAQALEDIPEEDDAMDDEDTSTYQDTELSGPNEEATTEQNTCEDLPSAQRVPAPLGVSDRVTSLHSTALPKGNSELDSQPGFDTQLSTQAALLHAQKSFQDDLDSPEYYNHQTPGHDRPVHSPSGSTHPMNVTPFYRLEESIRRDLEQSIKITSTDKRQAMSTQFMLDAATPFNFSTEQAGQERSLNRTNRNMTQMNTQFMLDAATPYAFSTEKRQRASRPGSSSPTRSSKRKRTANSGSPSSSVKTQSTSGDEDYHTIGSQSSGGEASPQPVVQQPDHHPTHRSITDASLPFTLSGSTLTTGQDGQGVHQGMETFNLSQAIADAGSWLQQSFDFMKDTGLTNQNPRTIPTSEPQPPPLMDLSQ
ncbi:hypothetical protein N7457_004870 [Penicillium paradoxum]|uniref:uncharacterized protein n=1 Tax=Penicillium paradoxum TaxID=176176 RepID=UPI0025499328|nr:uncharacterized protein N7457_004870 [Penicillium paradoxum]KAJ5783096.1 hypothetical protein N7457_004870 [Penicillium paradoxum]